MSKRRGIREVSIDKMLDRQTTLICRLRLRLQVISFKVPSHATLVTQINGKALTKSRKHDCEERP